MRNIFVAAALTLSSGHVYARSINCDGVVYQGKTSISTEEPAVFKQYGLDADLYMIVAQPSGNSLPIDLQKLSETETATSLQLTYVWCPKATQTAAWCGKAIRVLEINKSTGDAQFYNQQEDGSNYPVSRALSCKVQ